MNFVAAFLSKLAIGILSVLLARKDLKDSVRKDIALASERFAKDAEAYKASHPIDPHAPIGGDFRVRRKPNRPRGV